jgi:outer membrane protein OmpA-like peptidoglycan-associated protein
VFGAYLFNSHSADFKALPSCPSCSPGYQDGSGSGFSFGAIFEYKLSPLFTLGARLSYNDISALLKRDESTTVIIDGKATPGAFEHSIDATLSTLGIEPMLKVAIYDRLSLNFGFFAGTLLSKKYEQKEEITKPSNTGTFVDGNGIDTKKRTRNEFSGDLKNPSSFLIFPNVGLSYSLPLNKNNSLTLEPEVAYYLGLNNIVDDPKVSEWKANSLKLGVALKYTPLIQKELMKKSEKIYQTDTIRAFKDMITKTYVALGSESSVSKDEIIDETLVTTETISRTDTMYMPKKYELSSDITAVGVDANGAEIVNPKIVVEEFVSNKLEPLLNYIFYDENSSKLQTKYKTISKAETRNFNENSLYANETIDIYYNLLNIVAKRLIEHPNANLKIVGCNSYINDEKSNNDLSKLRAEGVRDYLTSVWGIEDSRLSIEFRNLPENASKPIDVPEKAAENRRVELYSNDNSILSPLFLADTMRTANPPIVRFYPKAKSDAGVKSWEVSANQDPVEKNFSKSGEGDIVKSIDWVLTGNHIKEPKYQMPIKYFIKVKDQRDNESASEIKSLPLELVTISKKRDNKVNDKIIEKFSLILFDFDKSEIIGANKSIVNFIRDRIKDNSTVKIVGYTDKLGDEEYNHKLSDKRAKSVKKAIGSKSAEAEGVGESELLFDNANPEGRFYCRTVNITIETPVTK